MMNTSVKWSLFFSIADLQPQPPKLQAQRRCTRESILQLQSCLGFFSFVLQLIKTAVGAWREMSNLKLLCILNSWLLSQNKLWPSSSFKAILAHVKQNIQQYIPRWVPDVRGRKHTAVGLRSPELFFKTKDTSHLCWAVRLAEGLQRLEEGKGRLSYTKECQFMPHQRAVM